ncbi:hypothetical protein Skr01_05480 [Sphaerisporangium krabiense]|uniref:Pyruvate/2-oxoglutarate dehydrogenase complex dihydrolipoamide acyltransferase (E2) component n=1 Tax=Sphaerisporangium krabiense TaxID=763782 RepID=A0A7W8Z7A6_9ACTN|nr:septum formation initiator [Sphaerisporangium krabiense]MBB5628697.1 pyruvate/2-oxoglutarate dehydrogenase complex dihydrolipoamide acyltransferase (E2) component [Sphaerisporangium krabiense]GII60463.1 hypothetical protein Skr01_05480 [Sphaerisporangium krabiense]
MKRRPLLVVAGWLVVALVATGAGVVVTTFLGESVTGAGRVMSSADVRRALEAAPPPGTAVPSPAGPSPAAATPAPREAAEPAAGRAFRGRGGVVVARCSGGLVTLLTWTPSPGYAVKDAESGPRDKARVRFEAGDDEETEIEVRCSGGRPTASVEDD